MSISKSIAATVLDQLLNYIKNNCTMILYSTVTTNPANAAAITGVIGTKSGLTSADFNVVSGTSISTQAAALAALTASGTGTATCIIFKTGTTNTDGTILAITTGSTVLTSGQQYTPSAITLAPGAPT